jgi:antitoxin (DNA-binding transcriptional repressor) of toxin-antitoxin stability system
LIAERGARSTQLRDFNAPRSNLIRVDLVTTGSYHETMKSVGVKQLKSRLSEYLRLVRSGETVFVTDRDEVVAELRPTRRQPSIADSLDGLLDSLAERGEVTRASLPKRRWTWKVKGLGLAAGSAKALLGEIRSDR